MHRWAGAWGAMGRIKGFACAVLAIGVLAAGAVIAEARPSGADVQLSRPTVALYGFRKAATLTRPEQFITSSRASVAGFTRVSVEGVVFSPSATRPPGTTPMWTYTSTLPGVDLRFTTTDPAPPQATRERLEGYIYTGSALGTAPLRLWFRTGGGQRLTNDPAWVPGPNGRGGPNSAWTFQGVLGWVVPERKVTGAGLGGGTMYRGKPALGSRPLVVALLEFSDEEFRPEHGHPYYRELIHGQGPSVLNHMRAMSHDRFALTQTPGVIGITFPGTLADADALGQPGYPEKLFELITNVAHLGEYDVDQDGTVEVEELAVVIIRADEGMPDFAGQTSGPWPYERPATATRPAYKVNAAISYVPEQASINLISHELTHQIRPGDSDIYGNGSTGHAYSQTLSVMSYSAFGDADLEADGDADLVGYLVDPWFKMRLGWDEPLVWHPSWGGSCVSMPTADLYRAGGPRSIAIVDPRHRSTAGGLEYFMLESRANRGWDRPFDTAGGLAVWLVQTDPNHNLFRAAAPWNMPGDNSLWTIGSRSDTDATRRGSRYLWRTNNMAARGLHYFDPAAPKDVAVAGKRVINVWPGSLDGREGPSAPHTRQDVEWVRNGDTNVYAPRLDSVTYAVSGDLAETRFDLRGAFGVDEIRRTSWVVSLTQLGKPSTTIPLAITSNSCDRLTASMAGPLTAGSYQLTVRNSVSGVVTTSAPFSFKVAA